MRKIFFLLMLFGNFMYVSGQADFEDKDRERTFRNKVKQQIQWEYDYENGAPGTKGYKCSSTTFDKNGNAIEVINYDIKGAVTSVLTYTFDAKNNKTSYSRYKGNKEVLSYNQNITYDSKGNKITESGFDGVSRYSNTFTYDAGGKVLEIQYTTDKVLTEKRLFKHSGKTTEMTIVNPSNVMLSKEISIVDSKNNVLEETKYIQNNLTQKNNYAYDPSGKKIEETKEHLGNLAYRKKYTYNPQGMIVEISEERTGVKPFIAYQYKYDAKGNLLEEKWTKDPAKDNSKKNHKYDAKGLLIETNAYMSTYKLSVLYKYSYETF
jgi:hypothetical protein